MRHFPSALLAVALVLVLGACRTPPRRTPPPPASPLAKAVVRTARRYLPEEDARAPAPKDCSDFVGRVFRERGIRLPRTSEGMSHQGQRVASARDLRMADLVFFSGVGGGKRVGHVAIYVHNGVFIHQANPGEGVRMESLYSDYWRRHYLWARRVID